MRNQTLLDTTMLWRIRRRTRLAMPKTICVGLIVIEAWFRGY